MSEQVRGQPYRPASLAREQCSETILSTPVNKSYEKYLKSDHWKILRSAKYQTANHRCAICGRNDLPLDVHHLNYRNLIDVTTKDLRILCRTCHYLTHQLLKTGAIHFRHDGHNHRFAIIKRGVRSYLRGGKIKSSERPKLWKKLDAQITPDIPSILDRLFLAETIAKRHQEVRRFKHDERSYSALLR